jgi:PKD repeat protein
MKKGNLIGRIFAIALVFVMIGSMVGSAILAESEYYATKEEAVSHVPTHVEPKGCFVWKDGPTAIPWRVIPGTGCAHWVAHELGLGIFPSPWQQWEAGEIEPPLPAEAWEVCYDGFYINVGNVIAGRTEVEIKDAKAGDIWAIDYEGDGKWDHCGIVRQIGEDEVLVEHCSDVQGGVVQTWLSSGKCWRGRWGKSHNVAVIDDYYGSAVGYLYPSDYPNQTFSTLSASQVSAETLAGYDTVILYMFNPSVLTSTQKADMVSWVSNGGKLIIWDSDQVPPNSPWDYSWLPYPFTTSVPGQTGQTGQGLNILEENQLSSSDPSSPYYIDTAVLNSQTDAVGDANVLTSYSSGWQIDMMATNVLGETGPAHVYAGWGLGLIIYSALDWDYAGYNIATGEGLKKMLKQELDCFELPFAAPPVPEEVGLRVEVTSEAPEGYYKDKPIEFRVTVTNPTDTTGINLDAQNVRLTVIAPEEIEIELPPGGPSMVNIAPGDSNIATFSGTMKEIGNNFEVKVNAVGYTSLGPIGGSGICYINIHEFVIPDWSFAVIADPHIGYGKPYFDGAPDYYGEGYEDSEPLPQECNHAATDWLDSAVKRIIMEKDYYNIEFVVVLGDFADTAEKSEFFKAREILNKLNDAGIPYIPIIGDHDQWSYIQPAPPPGEEGNFDPDKRDVSEEYRASHAYGDEWFNDIFWGVENTDNLNLIKDLFEIEPVKAYRTEVSIGEEEEIFYLQNRKFSYEGIDFICLDFNPRTVQPGDYRGLFAAGYAHINKPFEMVVYELSKMFLENRIEDGKTTMILSHHPLETLGGFPWLQASEIQEIVSEHNCDYKTYNFGGHVHYSYVVPGEYDIIATEAVNEVVPAVKIHFLGGERGYKPIRVVQVNEDEIDYSTLLRPVKEVTIEWPYPDFVWSYASYPEPNKETTFTAYYTTYHGFKYWFDWDFGDGSYGSGSAVTHTYSQEGDYEVKLTVTTRNLITSEETTQSITRTVCVRNKHVISSLPPDLNATSLITEEDLTQVPKNTYEPTLIAKQASEETPIGELGVHFEEANEDIDLSSIVADIDLAEVKTVLYMPSWPEEIEQYKTLFIPSTGLGGVYICLDAISLDDISAENADLVINIGETKNGITVTTTHYNGREYYLVSGVTGTGGGEVANTPPIADAGPDQMVCVIPPATTAIVTLDGSGSYDPDGDPLTYNWTWDGNIAYGVNPTVELPLGTTTITLVLNDGKIDSEPDTVDITVCIPAAIDFEPDVLNLDTKGKYVTAYIELPTGYDVSQIDVSSIRLNCTVPALGKPTEIGDYDDDGVPDLMVKFHRTMVQDALTTGEGVGVTITGEVNGIIFEGGDAIRVITPAAAHGRGEWTRVSTPTTEGWALAPDSVIVDYAVADDGEIAYAIVYSDVTSEFHLLKSTDGAATWKDITDGLDDVLDDNDYINYLPRVATDCVAPGFLAVALDMWDDSEGANEVHVFISNDGGATFIDTGEVEDGSICFPDGSYVSDLAVSPEDDDEREIAIGGRDNYGDAALFRCTVSGDSAGAWKDATDIADYRGWDNMWPGDSDTTDDLHSDLVTDITFSPSWDEDETILVTNVAPGSTSDETLYLQCGTSEGWNEKSKLGIEAVSIKDDVDLPSFPDARRIAGMTLPEDYDSTYPDTSVLWVWVNYYDPYPTAANEIVRVEDDDAGTAGPMSQIEDGEVWLTNISYQGTIAEGKAIAGVLGTGDDTILTACCEGVDVYRNDGIANMIICCKPWKSACKPPTGRTAMAVSYVGGDKAYAVNLWDLPSYDESAWSVTFDDGDTWNQLSLIDTHIDYLSDVAVSPDCNKTMLVSVNLLEPISPDDPCGCDSVWLHAENLPEAEEYSGKWLRTWCGELENNYGLLRLNPEEETGETVFLVDRMSGNVYWNNLEGLGCWDSIPSTEVTHIVDLSAQDANTVYALDYYGDVAMFDEYEWQEAVDSEIEYGWTMAVRGNDVLVGGCDSDVSYSDDGGETFTELEKVPVVAADYTLVTVAFDSYFDANDTAYAVVAGFAGSSPTTGGIYRWVIGESTEWEDLNAAPHAYTGLVLGCSRGKPETSPDTGGVLYASYVSGDTTGVARCLTPAADVRSGRIKWDYLTKGLTSELFYRMPHALKICGCLTTDSNSRLFAIDSSDYYGMEEGLRGTVWSFED